MLESGHEDFDEEIKPSWELPAGLKDSVGRHDSFWQQISMGSTATGTPLSVNAPHWELASLSSGCTELRPGEREDSIGSLSLEKPVKIGKPLGPVQARSWRRRKYMDSRLVQEYLVEQSAETEAEHLEDLKVLICGALQQRFWGFAWRWRWCVLDEEKLCIYRDEACWREAPTEPFDTIQVADIIAVSECSFSEAQTFRCMSEHGSNLATFRGGDGELWEEAAAVHLWVDMVNSAAREARLADASARQMSGLIWHQELQEAQLNS